MYKIVCLHCDTWGMIRTAQEVVKMKKKYASGVLLSAALFMMPVTGFASQEGMFEFLPAAAIEAMQQANEDGARKEADKTAQPAEEKQQSKGKADAAAEKILQKAAQAEESAAAALKEAQQTAASIEYKDLVGAWQLTRLGDQEVSFLYVDGTLLFEPKESVDLRQFLKNRDRTDSFTAKAAVKRDSAGVLTFAPAAETVTVRSYEDRPVAKSDLEDQLWPWLSRYDDADAAGNNETHARTIQRSYQVTKLVGDTLTVVETYSDSDGCDKRELALTYTRGLHQVTDEERAAEQRLQDELAANQVARHTKRSATEIEAIKERVAGKTKKETKAEAKQRKQKAAQAKRAAEEAARQQAAAEARAQEYAALPDLRIEG